MTIEPGANAGTGLALHGQEFAPQPGTPVHLYQRNGQWLVLADDGLPLGTLQAAINPDRRGLVHATVSGEAEKIDLVYFGPDDLPSRQ